MDDQPYVAYVVGVGDNEKNIPVAPMVGGDVHHVQVQNVTASRPKTYVNVTPIRFSILCVNIHTHTHINTVTSQQQSMKDAGVRFR